MDLTKCKMATSVPRLISFRDELRARKTPRHYSGLGHFWINTALCLVGIAVCLSRVGRPTLLELSFVPGALLYANFAEYMVHRHLMHKKTRYFEILYRS